MRSQVFELDRKCYNFNINFAQAFAKNMAEPLRNSKKNIVDTVANTDGRSKPSPSNPFSDPQNQAQYPYSSRQNSSRLSDLGVQNFELSIQNIIPLLSAVKQENQHFNAEKGLIQSDMTRLQSLSQSLLVQNQSLRRHYSQRTGDIRKLIETITMNTNEQISDVSHQSHLLKESNCAIVKKIEEQMKFLAEMSDLNSARTIELQSISQSVFELQQTSRDIKIKNQQLASKCERASKEMNLYDSAGNDEEIDELLIEVTGLRNYNRSKAMKAKGIQTQHREERPLFSENYTSVAIQNKELEAEVMGLKQATKNEAKKLEVAKENAEKNKVKYTQAFEQYYKVRNQLQQQQETLVKSRKLIGDATGNAARSTEQLNQLKSESIKLAQEVKSRKDKLNVVKQQHKQAQQKNKQAHGALIDNIRSQNAAQAAGVNQELRKLTAEQISIKDSVEQSKQEFATLVQDLNQYRQNINRLQNPIREIIRLEYQLKKHSRGRV